MCDEPTDPQDNGANDSEPQDSNANASTGTGTTQDALPQDLTHLIAQFLSSVTPSDLDDFAQSFHHRPPPPSPVITSNRALQNHLIQVQLLAGIPPGQIMPMIAPLPSRRGAPPAMLQFRQDGCAMPMIPRATFNGPVMPLFTVRPETATPGCSTDGDSDGSTVSSSCSDSSGSFEMPDASDDIEIYMDEDTEEDTDTQEDMDTQENGSQQG